MGSLPETVAHTLSAREREVFDLVGRGIKSRDIARRLAISPRTVDSHRANIIAKLGLDGASALIRLAALSSHAHPHEAIVRWKAGEKM